VYPPPQCTHGWTCIWDLDNYTIGDENFNLFGTLLVKENTSTAMTNFPFSVFVFVDAAGLTSDDNFRSDIPLLTVYSY
jgi:hypothetical protein